MVAVAAPHEPKSCWQLRELQQEGIAKLYPGRRPRSRIRKLAAEREIDISKMMVIHEPEPKAAARRVMELLRMGHLPTWR